MFYSNHLPAWPILTAQPAIWVGILSASWVEIHLLARKPQKMMDHVWPVNALSQPTPPDFESVARGLHGWDGIATELKANTISLISFEVGMFAWMYLSFAVPFRPRLEPSSPADWFSMQIARPVGFVTAVPANYRLLQKG